MAGKKKDSVEGAGEQWLTLEAAIKQIIGLPRLKALFDRARQPVPIGLRSPNHAVTAYHLQREEEATLAPLFQLLAEAKMVIEVRPWSQVGAPMRRLRPDETSQLTIDLFAKSPLLRGPGGERLYARISSAADESKIPLKKLLEETINEMPFPDPANRRRGWKTAWSEKAADVINKRHRKEPKHVERTVARSVQNRMGGFRLWPE
jgi:hypothetical protein